MDVRYAVMAWLLLALVAGELHSRPWKISKDFWAHAAAVRELTRHPLDPRHPLVGTDDASVVMTPWTVAIAQAARWTGAGPFDALAVAGVVNLVGLLAALYWWVSELSGRRHAPFWTLVFTLFLWGPVRPWEYSGFLHLGLLSRVPYPSCFALTVALAGMAASHRYLRTGWIGWFLFTAASGPMVLLTHPVAAILLFVGMGAIAAGGTPDRITKGCVLFATTASMAFLAAWWWPYYPFFRLVGSGGGAFHWANRPMYEDVVLRTLPVWGVGLILLARLRAHRRDPLVWMVVGLAVVYLYGGLSRSFSYGRVISPLVLVLHLVLADWLAANAERLMRYFGASWSRRAAGLAAVAVVLAVCGNHIRGAVQDSVALRSLLRRPEGPPQLRPAYERYSFLPQYVGEDDVVLAEQRTAWPVAAFAGKIVSPSHPEAFVADAAQRAADVRRFTGNRASAEERKRVIDTYGVRWLLVDRGHATTGARLLKVFAEFGAPVASSHDLVLFRVR